MQLLLPVIIGKILAIAVGLYYFRCLPWPYRLLLLTIVLAALAESFGRYIAVHMHQHNSWMFNFYLIIDFTLNGIIAIAVTKGSTARRFFPVLMATYYIGWVAEIAINSLYVLANYTIVFGAVLLTVMYVFVLFNNSIFSGKNILGQPIFWLAMATILYCAPGIPYWGLHNYLINNAPKLSHQLNIINTVLDILRYPLAAISFILLGRQKTGALKTA